MFWAATAQTVAQCAAACAGDGSMYLINGVNRLLRNSCRLQCALSLEKAFQFGKFYFFQILCHIRIDVQRCGDIRMTQGILDDFDI